MGEVAKIENRKSLTRWSEPFLETRLCELLDRRDSFNDMPVVGPRTAAALQEFIDAIPPGLPDRSDCDRLVGLLANALPKQRGSDIEASALLDQYWLGLQDIPLDGLRFAYLRVLKDDRWFPTVARIREMARGSKVDLYRVRCRVAQALLTKHRREWSEPAGDMASPEQVAEIRRMIENVGRDETEEGK